MTEEVGRLYSDWRQQIGEVSVIKLDERSTGIVLGTNRFDAYIPVQWSGYDVGDGSPQTIAHLYEKAKRDQWNGASLTWNTPIGADEMFLPLEGHIIAMALMSMGITDKRVLVGVARQEFQWVISQILHGEQAALMVTAQLANSATTLDAKLYASTQVMDEARHVEVITRLLTTKLGGILPVPPVLRVLLDEILDTNKYLCKLVAMQMLVEGIALGAFRSIAKHAKNHLVKELFDGVARDESRHHAYGVMDVGRAIAYVGEEERTEAAEFAYRILEALHASRLYDLASAVELPEGIAPDDVVQAVTTNAAFKPGVAHGHRHVMKVLGDAGLITEKTRPRFQDLGILAAA